jgi:C-terminal processing protease CtpA/Prc
VFVGGVGTGSTFKALMEEAKAKTALNLDFSDQGGYGSSDHFSFNTRQVPVLFFFSGLHGDYHKTTDTPDKINQDSAAELLKVVATVAARLESAPDRPAFVRVAAPAQQATASARGYGAYFGSVPDMSDAPGGFRLSDVRDGSPAQKAGLKAGDVIFEFDGKPIRNLYDFTYALQSKKPGDEVTLKYRRNGQETETRAKLEARR